MGRDLQKRDVHSVLGERVQYSLALGVIALSLYIVGLPLFVIFFLGIFSVFVWKLFSAGSGTETRAIFEFYLAANEILRNDDRRWYAFEVQDAIHRGEKIIRKMSVVPPLVYFSLGALFHKLGDHDSAVKYLENIIEKDTGNEASIMYPTKELRDYVRILRKIEREPGEAPQTSAAIRSLERARRNRGYAILADARANAEARRVLPAAESDAERPTQRQGLFDHDISDDANGEHGLAAAQPAEGSRGVNDNTSDAPHTGRKPISEVLHDIYGDKVQ